MQFVASTIKSMKDEISKTENNALKAQYQTLEQAFLIYASSSSLSPPPPASQSKTSTPSSSSYNYDLLVLSFSELEIVPRTQGVIAKKPIPRKTRLVRYTGDIISKAAFLAGKE